jgi:hypothetical protein
LPGSTRLACHCGPVAVSVSVGRFPSDAELKLD